MATAIKAIPTLRGREAREFLRNVHDFDSFSFQVFLTGCQMPEKGRTVYAP